MRYPIGRQMACKHCNSDIEYHGERIWVDRGGNRHCVNSGMVRYDENGPILPFPAKQIHAPYIARGKYGEVIS